jgi:hypothetical protein
VNRKKAAAAVAKAAAAVASSEEKKKKSEVKEEVEEAEGVAVEARQRRTFLEVVLGGGAKSGVARPVAKAGPRGIDEAEEKVQTIKAAIVSLGESVAVADYRTQMKADLVVAEAAVVKAKSTKTTAAQLEAKAAYILREERRVEDLAVVVAKAQVSISIAMEALAGARLEWKAMHAELLLQGAGADTVAGEKAVSADMEVSLDQSEREELELFRAARTASAAGDADRAKRLMENDLAELELKRRRLSEQPVAAQPVA